ncbi:MAG: hypothetical protein LIO96_03450, partial [Lachnospiraceae bacterium]|nr:hypothetical protein [Lachnospiraceae bacterium]
MMKRTIRRCGMLTIMLTLMFLFTPVAGRAAAGEIQMETTETEGSEWGARASYAVPAARAGGSAPVAPGGPM